MLAVYSLAGLAAGLLVGFLLPVTLPVQWSAYAATALLAVLSSLIGAARADGEEHFVLGRFAWGLGINIVLGLLLTALGDRLDAPIYLAAVVYFGYRIFHNCNRIATRLLLRKSAQSGPDD